MVVSKLKNKKGPSEKKAEQFISKGGEVPDKTHSETKFTLRANREMITQIDTSRRALVGKVSRNNWILEAIHEKLQKGD